MTRDEILHAIDEAPPNGLAFGTIAALVEVAGDEPNPTPPVIAPCELCLAEHELDEHP